MPFLQPRKIVTFYEQDFRDLLGRGLLLYTTEAKVPRFAAP